MPTYEYECTHCGGNFELFQNINDKPLDVCPKCNKKVKRLISAGAGIIFNSKPQNTCPKANEGCDGCNQIPR